MKGPEKKSPRGEQSSNSTGTPPITLDDEDDLKSEKEKKKRTRTLGSPFQTKEKRKASSLEGYKSPKINLDSNNPRRATTNSNEKRAIANDDVIKSGWVIVNKTNSFCELVKSGWEVKLRCFSKIMVSMV
jgi:hypothetical protein